MDPIPLKRIDLTEASAIVRESQQGSGLMQLQRRFNIGAAAAMTLLERVHKADEKAALRQALVYIASGAGDSTHFWAQQGDIPLAAATRESIERFIRAISIMFEPDWTWTENHRGLTFDACVDKLWQMGVRA